MNEDSHNISANCASLDVSSMCHVIKTIKTANMEKKVVSFEKLIVSIFNVNADESLAVLFR